MRFLTTIALLFATVLTCGCRARTATSLQCERETALLRAEILDLEDKYYALKSQHQSSPMTGTASVANAGYVGSGVISSHGTPVYVDHQSYGSHGAPVYVDHQSYGSHGAPVYVDHQSYGSPIMHGEVIQGDVIYEDQLPQTIQYGTSVLPGAILPGTVVPEATLPLEQAAEPELSTPTDASIYQDEPTDPEAGLTEPPTSDSSAMNLVVPTLDNATSDLQELMIPDDDLEIEVGYEDLELDLDGESHQIERLEIVAAATRGKDLDGVPGHDGIELMVKTVNSDGDFVEHQGELTVTVQDQLAGEIGKWTFLPQELRLFLSRDELGNMGTLLHLPWTGKIPVSQQIEIRVSVMIDAIEYIATHDISIEPPTGEQTPAIVGWGDDNRWVSVPNSSRPRVDSYSTLPSQRVDGYSRSQGFASPPPRLKPSRPQASIERPRWKPVR